MNVNMLSIDVLGVIVQNAIMLSAVMQCQMLSGVAQSFLLMNVFSIKIPLVTL
jgi:hypothetical protein